MMDSVPKKIRPKNNKTISPQHKDRPFWLMPPEILSRAKFWFFVVGVGVIGGVLYTSMLMFQEISEYLHDKTFTFSPKIGDELVASDVHIEGLKLLDRASVMDLLKIPVSATSVSVVPAELQYRLRESPMIAHAEVIRQIHGKLMVRIIEHIPSAIRKLDDGSLVLLGEDGQAMKNLSATEARRVYPNLIRFAGFYAPKAYQQFLSVYPQFQETLPPLISAKRLRLNAWQLWFVRPDQSRYFVTLADAPRSSQDIQESLKLLIDLEARHQLSKRDIAGVDLRAYPKMLITQNVGEI